MLNTKKFLIFLILICSLVSISSAVGGFEDNLVGWSPGTAPFIDDDNPDSQKAVYIRTDEYYAGAKCAQITAGAKDYDFATMYLDYAFEVNFDNVDEITYYVKTDAVINHDGTAKFWCQIGDTRYNEVTSGGVYNTWTKQTIDTTSITGTKQLSFVSTAIAVSGLEEKYSMLLDNVALDGVLIPYGFSNQRFYVYDSDTNLPIENALVTVPAAAEYSDYTNSAGYTDYFSNLVSMHAYNYNVQKTGYNTISTSFTTGIESSLTTNVALTSTATPTPTPIPGEWGEDLFPTMTSDTTPEGVVSGSGVSSINTTRTFFNALDDSFDTFWISRYIEGAGPQFITYTFDSGKYCVKNYAVRVHIANADIAASSGVAYPAAFYLRGSNDGTSWDIIDEQHPASWDLGEIKYFDCSDNTDYHNIFQLYCFSSGLSSGNYSVAIADWQIFGLTQTPTQTPTPTPAPTTPTPTPIPTEYNPTINNPSNLKESIIFAYASVFGISDNDNANLIFAAIIIGFFAMMAGYTTHSGTGILAGGCIGFVLCLGLGLIPIWIFFAIVVMTIVFFVLKSGGE